MKEENGIYYFTDYEPYKVHGERNLNFSKEKGGYLLDLKDDEDSGVNYFKEMVINKLKTISNIKEIDIITIIPRSEEGKFREGMIRFAKSIENEFDNIEFIYCLNRTRTVPKKANGGPRSADLEKETIEAINVHEFRGKNILLFDDVTTTGTSLKSCKEILKENGAKGVACFALGKTVNHYSYHDVFSI